MAASPSRALSLFYLTFFGAFGIYLPYLNLYYDRIGLTGMQIGLLSALVPLSGLLIPPAGGMLADRLGRRRDLVILSTFLALAAFSIMFAVSSFGAIALVIGAFAVLRAPALPLVEATAIELAETGGPAYGRMRSWGSLAFIAVSLGAGNAVGLWGAEVILILMAALLGLNFLASLGLPRDRVRNDPRPAKPTGLIALLKRRDVLFFLLACVLSQGAHGPYYVFFSIHLERVGYAPHVIGVLWAIAVGCEIVAMLRMPVILKRFGTIPIMASALFLQSARWAICAESSALALIIVAQILHAASYAAFHVAAVTHTHRLFGQDRGASGQTIYSAATYGLGNVFGMALSGFFIDRLTIPGLFSIATGVAAAGGILVLGVFRRPDATS